MVSIVHQTKTPPHFFNNYVSHKTRYQYLIRMISSKELFLPFPYQTNCYSYDQNSDKSQEHCILNQMKKLEFDNCKCNRKWFYKSLNDTRNERICANNECRIQFNVNKMQSKCRKNCYNEYYNNRIEIEKRTDDKEFERIIIQLVKKRDKELIYIHLPKTSLIQYLGSIGGLISLWFGYSLYDITSKLLSKFFNSSHFRCNKFNLNFRLEKICRNTFLIIFFGLLLYQIFEEIKSYTKYETVFRTSLRPQIYLPHIKVFNSLYDRNIEGLKRIYPEFVDEVKKLNRRELLKHEIREFMMDLSLKYWTKLLEDNKYTEFMELLNPEKLIISCNFVINGQSIDCGKIIYRIVFIGINHICELGSISVQTNESYKNFLLEKGIEKDLEKISIELMRFDLNAIIMQSTDCQFLDDNNFETNVYYSSYSVNRLNKYDFRCEETGAEHSVLNANDCLNDCLLYLSNKTYGCIAINVYDINLDMNLLVARHNIAAKISRDIISPTKCRSSKISRDIISPDI